MILYDNDVERIVRYGQVKASKFEEEHQDNQAEVLQVCRVKLSLIALDVSCII